MKTDRRDAELLARLLMAGKLHPVRVPGDEEEALRDLVRAREAVRVDLMRCRHRLSKLLLRHGIRFEDGVAWTQRHRAWHYRTRPSVGRALTDRQERQPPEAIANRAQQRLHRVHDRMRGRGKAHNVIVVACARELACFLWAAATAD